MSPPGRSSSSSAAWRDLQATITLALVLVVGVVATPVRYVGAAIERDDAFVVVAGDELPGISVCISKLQSSPVGSRCVSSGD